LGSRFIQKRVPSTGDKGPFRESEKPILAWFQFVPALVVDTVVNAFSPEYGTDRDIGAVLAKPHYEDAFGKNLNVEQAVSHEKYYPLFTNMGNPPIRGEQVLICTFGGVNYYMGPVNTLNLPNFNPDTMKRVGTGPSLKDIPNDTTIAKHYGISKNYNLRPMKRLTKTSSPALDGVSRMEPGDIHGDMTFEGRHGNSIRIGSRSNNPYLFISNKRNANNSTESMVDGSLISITSDGTLQQHFGNYVIIEGANEAERLQSTVDASEQVFGFTLASDTLEEPNRFMGRMVSDVNNNQSIEELIYGYSGNQALFNSDRITINTKIDDIYMSSIKDIHIVKK